MVFDIKKCTKVLGMSIQDLTAYFYSDNGFIYSTQPERLQRSSDDLTGLFDKVILRKNTKKTASIACQPCHKPGVMLVEAY